MFSNRGPLEELQHRDIIHIDIDSDTYSINGEIINSEKIENKTDNIEIFIEDNTEILRCLDAVSTDVCPKINSENLYDVVCDNCENKEINYENIVWRLIGDVNDVYEEEMYGYSEGYIHREESGGTLINVDKKDKEKKA